MSLDLMSGVLVACWGWRGQEDGSGLIAGELAAGDGDSLQPAAELAASWGLDLLPDDGLASGCGFGGYQVAPLLDLSRLHGEAWDCPATGFELGRKVKAAGKATSLSVRVISENLTCSAGGATVGCQCS